MAVTTVVVEAVIVVAVSTAAVTPDAISDSTEVQQFFDRCLTSLSMPILFSVLDEPYCNSFAKSADHLPVSLQSVYDPEHLQCIYSNYLRQWSKW